MILLLFIVSYLLLLIPSIVIDWGSEEPIIKKTYNDAGVIIQEYEEKKTRVIYKDK